MKGVKKHILCFLTLIMRNYFLPEETYSNIQDISLDYLMNDLKVKGLIFDFDGTLIKKRKMSPETLEFIKKAKEYGFKISVVSNNIIVSNTILKSLDISTTKKFACKPLKKPFLNMAKRMKLSPEHIAVIGNNKISDIFGANRANMHSIYIQNNLNNIFIKRKTKNILKQSGIKHID